MPSTRKNSESGKPPQTVPPVPTVRTASRHLTQSRDVRKGGAQKEKEAKHRFTSFRVHRDFTVKTGGRPIAAA
jgi:hypothetical protein